MVGQNNLLTAVVTLGVAFSLLSSCRKQSSPEKTPVLRETVDLPLQDPDARVARLEQIRRAAIAQEITVPEDLVYTDVFRQAEVLPPVIDILVVIDNSYSMEEEQTNLADKLSALLSDLHEVDWQINVITTDNVCKRLPELPLKPDTPNMLALFQNAVKAGINGLGNEMALRNTVDHLNGRCTRDQKWTREGTDLAVLIVSDEDEDATSRYARKSEVFLRDMVTAGYEPGTGFKVYGIIGHPEVNCPDVEAPALTYADVVKATNGLWGSICSGDYSQTLAAISRDIRTNIKVEFPLRFKPVLSTVKLDLDGAAYNSDWTLIGQTLVLADSLPEGSALTVKYQVESFRLLQLGLHPEVYGLKEITLDGKALAADQYHYDHVANTVLLTFDPPAGGKIRTVMAETTPLRTSFAFPEVESGQVVCYLGESIFPAAATLARGQITFAEAPPEGAVLHCLY